jgi:hypothetical protein
MSGEIRQGGNFVYQRPVALDGFVKGPVHSR